jgi:hypothetical protein
VIKENGNRSSLSPERGVLINQFLIVLGGGGGELFYYWQSRK